VEANETGLVDKLTNLAQLDIDAALAYDQAIKNIDTGDEDIREALQSFQDDHMQHIEDLAKLIDSYGGEPPAFSKDLKGFVIEGVTAILSRVGTRSALVAMTSNETLTNSRYHAALGGDLPTDVRTLLEKNLADEQWHQEYITGSLKEKFSISITIGGAPRGKDVAASSHPASGEATV
jgi:hypothetical protein